MPQKKKNLEGCSPKELKQKVRQLEKSCAKLKKDLKHERQKNARLKRKISEINGAYGSFPTPFSEKRDKNSEQSKTLQEARILARSNVFNAGRFSKKSYLGYLIQTFKSSTIGMVFRRIARFFRRFRLARRIAAVVAAILVTLFLSAFFIALLPFLIILLTATLLAVVMGARAANRRMRRELQEIRQLRVVIGAEQLTFEDNTFGERSAKAMASLPHTAVLVVTPRLWSAKGLGGRGLFFTVRREADGLYLVRRGYYFILRRRVLDGLSCDISIMY